MQILGLMSRNETFSNNVSRNGDDMTWIPRMYRPLFPQTCFPFTPDVGCLHHWQEGRLTRPFPSEMSSTLKPIISHYGWCSKAMLINCASYSLFLSAQRSAGNHVQLVESF